MTDTSTTTGGLPAFLTPIGSPAADPGQIPAATGPIPAADIPIQPPTGPIPAPAADQPREAPFAIDTRGLAAFRDDPQAWSKALQLALEQATGQTVSEDGLYYFLADYQHAVQLAESRSIAFGIANATVPESLAGDPAEMVLRFRDQIAATTRQRRRSVPSGPTGA